MSYKHTVYLSIAKNKQGLDDLEYRRETKNIIMIIVPDKECKALDELGIFDIINKKYHLLIDFSETEDIPAEAIEGCIKLIESTSYKNGAFAKALRMAQKYKTYLEVDLS